MPSFVGRDFFNPSAPPAPTTLTVELGQLPSSENLLFSNTTRFGFNFILTENALMGGHSYVVGVIMQSVENSSHGELRREGFVMPTGLVTRQEIHEDWPYDEWPDHPWEGYIWQLGDFFVELGS